MREKPEQLEEDFNQVGREGSRTWLPSRSLLLFLLVAGLALVVIFFSTDDRKVKTVAAGTLICLANLFCINIILKLIWPQRWRWPRFHFSSRLWALVIMGGLLWANFSPEKHQIPLSLNPPSGLAVLKYGWPWTCVYLGNKNYRREGVEILWWDEDVVKHKVWGWGGNLMVGVLIPLMFVAVWEWFLTLRSRNADPIRRQNSN